MSGEAIDNSERLGGWVLRYFDGYCGPQCLEHGRQERDAERSRAQRWKMCARRLLQRIGKISEMFNAESRLRELESLCAKQHHHQGKALAFKLRQAEIERDAHKAEADRLRTGLWVEGDLLFGDDRDGMMAEIHHLRRGIEAYRRRVAANTDEDLAAACQEYQAWEREEGKRDEQV